MSTQPVPISAEHQKSYKLLNIARDRRAKEDKDYSAAHSRCKMQEEFTRRFHKPAYEWQLDVGEALCLGLDSLVLAGTGEGKSFPWLFPLLNDPSGEKKILVISPLNALEDDLARRFKALGFSSVAINGETWNRELQTDLEAGKHRVMLTSPEMALKHDGFRKLLSAPSFSKDIAVAIVDEAHCISQWGGVGGFREEYGEVGRLRAVLPPTVPILATTATATPTVQRQIRDALQFRDDDLFFINRGNDRHNITPEVVRMTGAASDYSALNFIIDDAQDGELQKTMVFCNTIQTTHDVAKYLRARLPHLKRREIAVYHALRTARAKKKAMRDFRNGKIRVLVTTEAAGMGADIPDVKLVVQFKVPASLSIWLQRAGRAARSPNILGRAVLLVEKSVFETRIPDISSAGTSGLRRYRKNVEEGLRAYIETTQCRRDVSDKYFLNPPRIRGQHICLGLPGWRISEFYQNSLFLAATTASKRLCCLPVQYPSPRPQRYSLHHLLILAL
ncbi:P-loop containing nucleoside triphosphate hydrolase protein [Rickenella mellea]|uniref:DNA 3'-5' helicase n=1 Tax=Rickenella mellea TaxID=50990 RepID=A0A4R5XHC3_9AGAM|nr:P-loop containing nucleoside triphosphate hydrolase protein [Rickenella mellea]